MRLHYRGTMLGLLFGAALASWVGPGAAEPVNDIREFRVGMPAADLPARGYLDFSCAAAPDRKIAGWADYKQCPADAAGRHEIGFRYDDSANPVARVNESYNGTLVGGHPVVISLLIGDDARVDAIRIETDPHARYYFRKKAFLFADQVKERYGQQGWACKDGAPSPEAQPVGGVFIRQHCEKTSAGRHLILDQTLYRDPKRDVRDFVGGTRLVIERSG